MNKSCVCPKCHQQHTKVQLEIRELMKEIVAENEIGKKEHIPDGRDSMREEIIFLRKRVKELGDLFEEELRENSNLRREIRELNSS